jgi:hypothetical protein
LSVLVEGVGSVGAGGRREITMCSSSDLRRVMKSFDHCSSGK